MTPSPLRSRLLSARAFFTPEGNSSSLRGWRGGREGGRAAPGGFASRCGGGKRTRAKSPQGGERSLLRILCGPGASLSAPPGRHERRSEARSHHRGAGTALPRLHLSRSLPASGSSQHSHKPRAGGGKRAGGRPARFARAQNASPPPTHPKQHANNKNAPGRSRSLPPPPPPAAAAPWAQEPSRPRRAPQAGSAGPGQTKLARGEDGKQHTIQCGSESCPPPPAALPLLRQESPAETRAHQSTSG